MSVRHVVVNIRFQKLVRKPKVLKPILPPEPCLWRFLFRMSLGQTGMGMVRWPLCQYACAIPRATPETAEAITL